LLGEDVTEIRGWHDNPQPQGASIHQKNARNSESTGEAWLYNRLVSELSIARRVDGAGTAEKKHLWGWTPIGTSLQLWPLGRFRR